jgi:uncharacterized protein YkwD
MLRTWNAPAAVAAMLLALLLVPSTSASAQDHADGRVARALELTNIERQKSGLAPLALNAQLTDAAQAYSIVLATSGCFAHNCGPVPEMADRLRDAGYTGWTAIAENIAAGYPTPEAVVQGWMSSPGHRANLLNPRYTEVGIGLAGGGRFGSYWTQNFGTRPFASAPAPAVPEPVLPEPEQEMAPVEPDPAVEPMPEPEMAPEEFVELEEESP